MKAILGENFDVKRVTIKEVDEAKLTQLHKELEELLEQSQTTILSIKILTAMISIKDNDPDLYWKRAHLYREIEMFIDAVDDLQRAADLRPYPQASISNKTFYEKMSSYFRRLGLDFN